MISKVYCGVRDAVRICNIRQFTVGSYKDFSAGSSENDHLAVDFDIERSCYEEQRLPALS